VTWMNECPVGQVLPRPTRMTSPILREKVNEGCTRSAQCCHVMHVHVQAVAESALATPRPIRLRDFEQDTGKGRDGSSCW
jgi:hypothetical protein